MRSKVRGVGSLAIFTAILAFVGMAAPVEGLSFQQVVLDGLDAEGLAGPRMVRLSPDGRHLYVASEFDHALAVFERDPKTGRVSFVEAEVDGVDGVEGLFGLGGVEVSPDGRHVYACAGFGSSVAAFERDPATGELTFVEAEFEGVDGVSGIFVAVWVQVSPDGEFVYVAGAASDAVAIFRRDKLTGELDFVGNAVDGVGGAEGLDAAFPIAMSPEGEHLYTGGIVDDAVGVYRRDRETGLLTLQQLLVDGVGGVEGLDGPRDVQVSPDGQNVYVGSLVSDSVAVFDRDPASGELTFLEAHFNGQNGIQSLDQAVSIAVTPDGSRVFVASFLGEAVVAFDRSRADGRLTFTGEVVDGTGSVQGLGGLISLTTSRDGGQLYGVGFSDDSLVTFDVSR